MGLLNIILGIEFDKTKAYMDYMRLEEVNRSIEDMDAKLMLYDWKSGIKINAVYSAFELIGKRSWLHLILYVVRGNILLASA